MSGEYTVGVPGWFACAWQILKTRPNTVMRGLAIVLLFSLVLVVLGLVPGGQFVVIAIQLTAGLVLQAGWNLFCLRLVREENPSPMVVLEPFNRFGQTWLVSILMLMLTFVGMLLFIIPGMYVLVRYGMSVISLVDRKIKVFEALDFSSMITEGYRLQILLLHLIIMGLSAIFLLPSFLEPERQMGMFMLLVYQFILMPLAGTAYAAAYESLVEIKTGEER